MNSPSEARKKGPSPRVWVVAIAGVIVVLLGMILLTRRAATAAPDQPIDFSHEIHSEAGVECLFCHTSAMRSDIAGIPSVQRCAGCHRTIATDHDEIKVVMGFWEREEPIPWQQVNDLPDHVFFSHQPHVLGGLTCEDCHGNVAQMTIVAPVTEMDMGWCLNCHLEQPEEKVARLADCLACHE